MNMTIVGNVVSFVGCVLMVYTGFLKQKRQILLVQCVQFGFLGAANLILGAFSGFISGLISIIRNLVFTRGYNALAVKLGFMGLQLSLSIRAVQGNAFEWLPVIAGFLFTWFLDAKKETTLKWAIAAAQGMWLVYDLHYQNFVSATFDVLTIGSNLIGIWMLRKPTN